jgi:hypothetical protein
MPKCLPIFSSVIAFARASECFERGYGEAVRTGDVLATPHLLGGMASCRLAMYRYTVLGFNSSLAARSARAKCGSASLKQARMRPARSMV